MQDALLAIAAGGALFNSWQIARLSGRADALDRHPLVMEDIPGFADADRYPTEEDARRYLREKLARVMPFVPFDLSDMPEEVTDSFGNRESSREAAVRYVRAKLAAARGCRSSRSPRSRGPLRCCRAPSRGARSSWTRALLER